MSGKSIWTTLLVSALPLLAQAPSIADGGVLNGASFAKGQVVAAGSLVSIFGSNLASRLALADSIPLSNSLGDVSVTFNNVPAPLVAVVPGGTGAVDQINAQVPWNALSQGTVSGPASVVVTRSGTASQPLTIQIGQFGPGIFSVQFGVGIAIAINADSSLAAPPNAVPGIATHPAKIGDPAGLMILGTGLGIVDPPGQTGRSSLDALRTATTTPIVLVGGVPAKVLFAGMSPEFPGVNQINIVVPDGAPPGDAVPLQIQLGDITTTDKVTIAITR
jgi:uncharacterized protein (TIGR03437 family)